MMAMLSVPGLPILVGFLQIMKGWSNEAQFFSIMLGVVLFCVLPGFALGRRLRDGRLRDVEPVVRRFLSLLALGLSAGAGFGVITVVEGLTKSGQISKNSLVGTLFIGASMFLIFLTCGAMIGLVGAKRR